MLIIMVSFSLNDYQKITLQDKAISYLENAVGVLLLIVLPFIFITNIGNIRNKLPLFKRKKMALSGLAWGLLFIFIMICFGSANSAFAKIHTPEYKAAKQKYDAEMEKKRAEEQTKREAEKTAKKLAEEKKKQEEAAKKAEEDKKKQEAEALAKQQKEQEKAEESAQKQKEKELKEVEEKKEKEQEEARKAEEKKKQEEEKVKQAEEEKRQEEAAKKAEEEKKKQAEAAKKAEEAKKLKTSKSNFNKANKAYDNGNYNEALRLYSLVIPSDPNYEEALRMIESAQMEIYLGQCAVYQYKELKKNADNFKGQKAQFYGKITHIQEVNNRTLIVLSTKDNGYNIWSDDVVITYDRRISVYEGDIINVYGEITGRYSSEWEDIMRWLGVSQLNFQYTRGTDPNAMPCLKAAYIF